VPQRARATPSATQTPATVPAAGATLSDESARTAALVWCPTDSIIAAAAVGIAVIAGGLYAAGVPQ